MPTIRCGHCRGTGRVELSDVYAETLALLRRRAVETTGAELARVDGCKATAMNNRLVMLERLGLVKSRVNGRKRLFRCKAR